MTEVLHINRPRVTMKSITCATCPDCKRKSRLIGTFQEWYGWTDTCLNCGRSYQDGEWLHLAFARGARKQSIEQAKSAYRRSTGKRIKRVVQ